MNGPGPDFFVLTGFLGSGKTTLLRDFLTRPETADTAAIVNEVGEIGLDGVILRESGGDTPIAMLSNGCVCCQVGNDLTYTISELLLAERPAGSPPLRRIILETSGLSKPGAVLRQLAGLAEHRMRIAVIATFDALRGTQTTTFEEAASQWAAAHRIVMTKTDTVSDERLAQANMEIVALNPLSEIVAKVDRDSAVAAAFAPLARIAPMPELPRISNGLAHPRIAVRLARQTGVFAYDDLATWLDNLAGAFGERLLRVKGLVRVAESARSILVQSVGTAFSPPRPIDTTGSNAEPFLVVIARDLRDGELDDVNPTGLFQFSSWTEPSAFTRPMPRRSLKAEWL